MKQDLISLAEQYPGLTVTVTLDDLLTVGRKLTAEILDHLDEHRDTVAVLPENNEKLLSKEEVMERFGVSRSTLWRWSQIGYLKPVKIGVGIRYKANDVENLLKKKGGEL